MPLADDIVLIDRIRKGVNQKAAIMEKYVNQNMSCQFSLYEKDKLEVISDENVVPK